MELISESLNDIECKLKILYSERKRLSKERQKEMDIDPYRISAIDYSKPITSNYKKYDVKVRDDTYIKKLDIKIENIENEISNLEKTKKEYLDILSKMDGIEYRLFSYILKGFGASRAIEKVIEENYMNDIKPASKSGIMPYYNNMKKNFKLY